MLLHGIIQMNLLKCYIIIFFYRTKFAINKITVRNVYKENKFKQLCLTKQLLSIFKLWCEWDLSCDACNVILTSE